ncbi:MAG: hypothetical protein ND866_13805 [Pyrinomonadaceae bacterium]|nr:hypothetical protein [Pyrinomonadaceae bacterium]
MQPETEVADGSGTRLIVAARKEAGVNFVSSLLDANLSKVLALVIADRDWTHVTLCRE